MKLELNVPLSYSIIWTFAKSNHFIYLVPLESFNQIRVYLYSFHRCPNLLSFEEPSEFDSLTEELNEHQLLHDNDIPCYGIMQDRPRWLKIGFTLKFYWANERSRRKRSSFSTSLEGCQAYFNYPSFECRRRASFSHRKEEQNLLSAKVGSRGDTSQHRHCKTRSGVWKCWYF